MLSFNIEFNILAIVDTTVAKRDGKDIMNVCECSDIEDLQIMF